MVNCGEFPAWLEVLLKEKFFNACIEHEDVRRNEKNILCIDCCLSLCPHCLPSHNSHRLLQIRRYVYHDVLRVDDGSKLMDCSLIQSYITNSSKVIFINERPHSRYFRCAGKVCVTCKRALQSPYSFCSLSCKISDVIMRQRGLSGFLKICKVLDLTDEGATTTPSSTLEPTGSNRTSSGSGGGGDDNNGVTDMFWCQTLACEIVRKKRSSLTYRRVTTVVSSSSPTNTEAQVNFSSSPPSDNEAPVKFSFSPPPSDNEAPVNFLNRRKNAPQRAPLY